jgi:hypothetical protein
MENSILESSQEEVDDGHKITLELNKDVHDEYFYKYGPSDSINPRDTRHSRFIDYICEHSDSLLESSPQLSETEQTLTTIELERDSYKRFKNLENEMNARFPDKLRGEVVSLLFRSAIDTLD